jgi:hypothetical protein
MKTLSIENITLRDYFAAQIAAGDAAADEGWSSGNVASAALIRARLYYLIADAMLKVREEPTNIKS